MKILIIAATSFEISPLIKYLNGKKDYAVNYLSFTFKNHSIDILVTGIGLTKTAYFLGKKVSTMRYDLLLNFGIGGTFTKEFKIGDVVNVTTETFADLGAEDGENFLDLFDLGFEKRDEYPFTKAKLINQNISTWQPISELPVAGGISVNKAHGEKKSILDVIKKYSPQIESMEGAAFFFVSLTEKIPFFQIRAISNQVEQRNRLLWDITLAIENLNKVAIDIVKQFGYLLESAEFSLF